jgi:ComF family protein
VSALATAGARLLDPVLALVFPSRCPGCGAPPERPTRGPLCAACWERLPRHRGRVCLCGRPLLAGGAGPCGRCRRGLTSFESGASLGPYEGTLRTLLHDLKYRGRRRLAARLAEALLREAAVRRVLTEDAVLAPVPLHPRKRRERGFNQAELLARELAARSGAEVCAGALVRRVDTPAQAGLSAAARRRNVARAFAVRQRARVAGRTVVLVDDVLTTGATALACARALAGAGARAVRVLTVARVV